MATIPEIVVPRSLLRFVVACSLLVIFAATAPSATANWTAIEAPLPSGYQVGAYGGFVSLDCPIAGSCVALARGIAPGGGTFYHGYGLTEAEGIWNANISFDLEGLFSTYQGPLACSAADTCVSVSWSYAGLTILTDRHGSWSSQPASLPPGGSNPAIYAVSCAEDESCVAVGSYAVGEAHFALILSESKGVWSTTPVQNPSGAVILQNVSCPQADACVASGTWHDAYGRNEPFIASQSATGWSEMVPPVSALAENADAVITALACPGVNTCTAVGSSDYHGALGLIFTDTGGSWSVTEAPAPTNFSSASNFPEFDPSSLSCPQVANCVAVGTYSIGEGAASTNEKMILEENEGHWSAVEAPQSAHSTGPNIYGIGMLNAVECPAVDACVAVGVENNPEGGGVLLVKSGSTWSAQVAPLPPGGGIYNADFLLACPAPGACTVAGDYGESYGSGVVKGALIYQGGPVVKPPPGGGLTVQQPPPTPPLTVTTAGGGGIGIAGAPDPSSFEHGQCDPGDSTSWLNISGTTFTCIVSLQVWNDPTLLSARDKCVINLGVDFLPFIKALKLRKYAREAETVTLSLDTLAKRLVSISYPGKLSGDAQAVADIKTALDLIRNPEQAILTVISSRRVLDGLITKLGRGGAAALKLAQEVAVVKAAVVGLIESVSGIQDLKDCRTAFNGP